MAAARSQFALDSLYRIGYKHGVGLLLRQWRDRRKLSLHQLADKAGVSYVTISRIENDRMSPTVDMLEKLAKALDISVRDLFPVERRRGTKEEDSQ